MTRGLFLRADTDSKTAMAVWRRVMGVLCGRYPAWQLDSFTCIDEETEPEGAYTSREFMRWLDGEHYILFARAFGYADETVRETICDYEDYRRAACRCIEKKHVYTFDPPKEGGSADDVGTGRNER